MLFRNVDASENKYIWKINVLHSGQWTQYFCKDYKQRDEYIRLENCDDSSYTVLVPYTNLIEIKPNK